MDEARKAAIRREVENQSASHAIEQTMRFFTNLPKGQDRLSIDNETAAALVQVVGLNDEDLRAWAFQRAAASGQDSESLFKAAEVARSLAKDILENYGPKKSIN